jgi:hypothetical protein
VAHISVQAVVGVYAIFMPASQQPSTGQGAHSLPLKNVGGGHAMQPLVLSTRCPGGQSERQSMPDVAPGSETVPAGHEVGEHVVEAPACA